MFADLGQLHPWFVLPAQNVLLFRDRSCHSTIECETGSFKVTFELLAIPST